MSEVDGDGGGLQVEFDCAGTRVVSAGRGVCLQLPLRVLGGGRVETILVGGEQREANGFQVVESGGRLAGVTTVPIAQGFEEAAYDVYSRLLRTVGEGWKVYRIWNYVPAINEERGGMENYRSFNLGRWKAYGGGEGKPIDGCLPAASAVGVGGEELAVIFLAGRDEVEYFENPQQIPAYQYPSDYGPRPPCFCRGARVADGEIFLSGTASIRGHESAGGDDLAQQVEVTGQNVELMLGEMGANGGGRYKCYVRHEADFEGIRTFLDERYRGAMFLEADICRAELLLEMEAVVPPRG